MNPFTDALWSPYLVGACIGILEMISFFLSNKAISCSTAYARTMGMIERIFRGKKVMDKPYYKKVIPTIDWGWMLVLGIVIGAFASSVLSGGFKIVLVPRFWRHLLGTNLFIRLGGALLGGILLGFGARMAGGCTSGHGISGTLQLAVSSWIAFICFFLGGILTAFLLFGGI